MSLKFWYKKYKNMDYFVFTLIGIFIVILNVRLVHSQSCGTPTLNPRVTIPAPTTAPTYYYYEYVAVTCTSGEVIGGDAYGYCIGNDMWDPDITELECAVDCSNPSSSVPYLNVSPDKSEYRVDNDPFITYSCDSGYQLSGEPTAQCQIDGTWNPAAVPTCEAPVICAAPANSNGTGDYSRGETVTFSCNEGYVLYDGGDTSSLTCEDDGEWTSTPVCIELAGCPAIEESTNVDYTYSIPPNLGLYAVHTLIEMVCAGERTPFGPTFSFCNESYVWDPEPSKLTCYEKCPKPTFDDTRVSVISDLTGNTNEDYFDHTDTIRFVCPDNIFVDGPRRASCRNGTWSSKVGGNRPVCRANCTAPTNMLNEGEVFRHGQRYTFTCDPTIKGLVRLGGPQAFCNDGTWKPNLKCRLKSEL